MRKITPGRRSRLQIIFACALAVTTALTGVSAFAQDDEEDLSWDTKMMRRFLKDLGLQRGGEASIEYRERAPLVVPPSRSLPQPRSQTSVTSNPAWPKDPDVQQRNQDIATTAAQRAKIRGTAAESMIDDARPLRRDEMATGTTTDTTTASPGTTLTPEDGSRPLRPSELGVNKGLWGMLSHIGPEKPEYAPFQGEPDRGALTAPPSGYQTPSPAQPYGVTPGKNQYKPPDAADRAVNTSR